MIASDTFASVAATSMVAMAINDLHLEVVAGAGAWLVGWWLLREGSA